VIVNSSIIDAQKFDLYLDESTDFWGKWNIVVNGQPFDVTPYTFVSKIKLSSGSPDIILDLSQYFSDMSAVGNPDGLAEGDVLLKLPKSVVQTIGVQCSSWGLAITSATDGNADLLFGTVYLKKA
jgi:hypothetical protein